MIDKESDSDYFCWRVISYILYLAGKLTLSALRI
jgi:hypothetical protein